MATWRELSSCSGGPREESKGSKGLGMMAAACQHSDNWAQGLPTWGQAASGPSLYRLSSPFREGTPWTSTHSPNAPNSPACWRHSPLRQTPPCALNPGLCWVPLAKCQGLAMTGRRHGGNTDLQVTVTEREASVARHEALWSNTGGLETAAWMGDSRRSPQLFWGYKMNKEVSYSPDNLIVTTGPVPVLMLAMELRNGPNVGLHFVSTCWDQASSALSLIPSLLPTSCPFGVETEVQSVDMPGQTLPRYF